MTHSIITYCSGNFTDCLAKSLPTWLKANLAVTVFTDNKAALEAILPPSVGLVAPPEWEKSKNKRVSCTRKIETIAKSIKLEVADKLTWLDSDCFVLKDFTSIYDRVKADLLVTRMVLRKSRVNYSVNAGVSFWRVNERTEKFCQEWLKIAEELEPTVNLHEQEAFNKLAYRCFDSFGQCSVAPVSELIFNLEHEQYDELKRLIAKGKAAIVHLKGGRWKQSEDYLNGCV